MRYPIWLGISLVCLCGLPALAQDNNKGFASQGVSISFHNAGGDTKGQGVTVGFGDCTAPTIIKLEPFSVDVSKSATDSRIVRVTGTGFKTGLLVNATTPDKKTYELKGDAQIKNLTATSFELVISPEAVGDWSISVRNPDCVESNSLVLKVITQGVELAVSISAPPSPIYVSSNVSYTIHVTNNSDSQANNVVLTDTFPDALTAESTVTSQGSCSITTSKVTCSIGALSKNASANITIGMVAKKSGEVTNTATVTTNGVAGKTATATSTIVPLVVPLGKGRLYGTINKAWPTIVLTHGLSNKNEKAGVPDNLWIGNNTDEGARGAGALLAGKLKELKKNVNVLQFVWDDAFQVDGTIPVRSEYLAARDKAQNAGETLAKLLLEILGKEYDKEIHFIGHSLGTVVSTYAAGNFLRDATSVTKAQFSALDRPDRVHIIPGTTGLSGDFDSKGFPTSFFATTLKTLLSNRTNLNFLRVDNYFSPTGLGVGGVAASADGISIYNHTPLIDPGNLTDKNFFHNESGGNDHSGVQQWYRLTINPELYTDSARKNVCDGAQFNRPKGWDKSLNPCNQGWYWSILGSNPSAFPTVNYEASPLKSTTQALADSGFNNIRGCQHGNTISCQLSTTAITTNNENNAMSSGNAFATTTVDLPAGTNYLMFEYKFSNIGEGDYAAVLIGDNPIWSLIGTNFTKQDFVSSGPIPITGYKGSITLTLALYGVGATNTKIEFRNFAGIAVNSPPVFEQLDSYTVTSGNLLTVDAVARDENGDSITFSLSGAPAGASIDPATGKFSWIPSVTQFGMFSFKIRATDNSADKLFSEQTVNVLVLEPTGFEADISPRPGGKKNGTVTIADWIQTGRFVVGLDTPEIGSEFQRADSAPKSTKGDGRISLADWAQAGRYAIALDPVIAVGGAFAPTESTVLSTDFSRVEAGTPPKGGTLNALDATRTIRAVNTNFTRGQVGTVQIALDAQGNENAVSFSLNFDPKAMSFLEATAGDGANGAAVIVNASQAANGRVGLAMMLPAGQQFVAGTRNLLNLRFIPNGGDGAVSTSISFSDQMLAREVVDALATPIAQVSYVGSTVNISGKAVATVSAANYVGGEQAAESIVSAFGLQLSSFTQAAPSLPLPISLGGSQVVVKDSKNVERFAPLFYVSPTQINFQIPAGTVEGVATLTIFSGAGTSQTGLLAVGKVVPAIFSADATGAGFAAGSALTVNADGARTENNLAVYDSGKFVAQPIDVSGTKQVYLTLYGTGIKNRSDLANVKIKIGGIDAQVEYAGAQGYFAGLDQLNIRVPQGLIGRGSVNIEMNVEGKTSNVTTISIK